MNVFQVYLGGRILVSLVLVGIKSDWQHLYVDVRGDSLQVAFARQQRVTIKLFSPVWEDSQLLSLYTDQFEREFTLSVLTDALQDGIYTEAT